MRNGCLKDFHGFLYLIAMNINHFEFSLLWVHYFLELVTKWSLQCVYTICVGFGRSGRNCFALWVHSRWHSSLFLILIQIINISDVNQIIIYQFCIFYTDFNNQVKIKFVSKLEVMNKGGRFSSSNFWCESIF